MGQIHMAQKDYSAAEAAFQTAIAAQPAWPVPHNNMARLYLAQDKKTEAVARLEGALGSNRDNPQAYLTLGMLYQESGELGKARDTYRAAVEAHPRMWAAANNLAFLISENPRSEADLEEALNYANQADQINPENPVILDTVGWIYYKKGDLSQAEQALEKALALDPDNPVINYHTAMVLYDTGRQLEAVGKLERALADDQGFFGRDAAEQALQEMKAGS
jgi:Tfp pilus assembly protein PilF